MKDYLLSLAAAGILLALIQRLVPKGAIRRLAVFTGAMVLILTVLSPLISVKPEDLARSFAEYQMEQETLRTGVAVKNRDIMADIIKEKSEAYILDKAADMDLSLVVEVELTREGQYPYPVSVVLQGSASEEQKKNLQDIIARELGVPADRQEWVED